MTDRILRKELISHCPLDSFVLASTLLSDQDFSSRLREVYCAETEREVPPPGCPPRARLIMHLAPNEKSAGDKDRFEDLDSVTRRGGDNLLGT
jgi:hypothetical protein